MARATAERDQHLLAHVTFAHVAASTRRRRVCVCVCKRRRCRHTRLPQSAGISFRASLVANVQRVALVSFIAIYARAYRHASVIGLSGCSNHS